MKMKLVVLALSGVVLASGIARAEDCDPTFYIGGEVQANQYEKGVKKITTPRGTTITATNNNALTGKGGAGVSAIAGTRLHENFGAEVGVTGLSGSHVKFNTPSNKLKTKSHNLHADVLGYVPVSKEVDLIGSVGVGHLTTKISGNVLREKISMKSSKAGLRVGLGAQYKLCDNLNARFMVRHQKGNKFVKSVNSAGLGLFYQF